MRKTLCIVLKLILILTLVLGLSSCGGCKHDDLTSSVTEPTCTERGYTTYTCNECGYSYKDDYVDALGHTEATDVAVAPTCTATGLTEGKHCSVCGETVITQEIVAALEHKDENKDHKCDVCGNEVICAHNYGVWIDEVPALCGESGVLGHYTCSDCNLNFDANKTVINDLVIPAPGEHTFTDWVTVKSGGCSDVSYKIKACVSCGYYKVDSDGVNVTHPHEFKLITKEATCYEDGIEYSFKCQNCDFVAMKKTTGALGHNFANDICTRCGLNSKYGTSGLEYTLNADEISYSCSGIGTADTRFVFIASEYNGLPVTSISANAFRNKSKLINIVIPNTVTSIGDYAFYDCSSLKSVTIPNSVTSIGDYAFYDCSSLTSVTIPDSVTSIGYGAFVYCSSLTSVTIGNGVTSIGDSAFYGCYNLTSVTIPDSVTSIGYYAFEYCYNLTSVTIPDSVTSIGYEAFSACSSLTSVTIPDGVTSIGSSAFENCSSLESITLPFVGATKDGNENTHFGYIFGAYSYSSNNSYVPSSLKTVVITGGASIDSYAFRDCSSLTSVTIPDGVMSIGDEAFYGCSSLTSVTIGNGVTSIGSSAFSGCYKLVEVINKSNLDITAGSDSNGYAGYYAIEVHQGKSKVVKKDNYLFYTYDGVNYLFGYVGKDTDLTLPESYNGENYVIYDYAFYDCTSLTSVTIPDSVTSICDYAFYNCSNLTSVTIGNGVTSIGYGAFAYCYSLTSVTIPDSVTSIGDYAFTDCYKLVEVINKSNLNITAGSDSNGYAGYYAIEVHQGESKIVNQDNYLFYTYDGVNYLFGYVGKDTDLTLPESYNGENYVIYNYAFLYCDSIRSITIPDSITGICDYAFYNCSNLTSVTIGNGVTSIGYGAFAYCYSLTSVTIGNAVTSIGNEAFFRCGSLATVTIPDSVTSIGDYAFSGCRSLTSVTIGNGVTSIGSYAFYDCDSLTSVTIGNSVTSIGDYAFYGCGSLTNVTIPDSVTSIGDCAFYYCLSLTSVTIGNGVTSIGDYAFSGCRSLTSVTIGNGVTSIGDSAFSGCTSLVYNEYDNAYYLGNEDNPYLVLVKAKSKDITSCNIHKDTKIIYNGAFSGCYSLESITLPFVGATKDGNENTHFGYIFGASSYSYNGDYVPSSLKTVVITGGASIDSYAFYYCRLKSVTIPDSVTSIGDYAFSSCDSLTSVKIGNGVTSIGGGAFRYCSSLTSVTIPDSVTSIGDDAFYGCSSLESITLPFVGATKDGNENTHFGYIFGAYSYSSNNSYVPSSLKTVVITGGTSIDSYAFRDCSSLTSVTIPDGVTSIGSDAFAGCYKLVEVINKSNLNITAGSSSYGEVGYYAIEVHQGESKIVNKDNYLFYTYNGVNYLFGYVGKDTDLTLPESYNGENYVIYDYAFYGCDSLTSVTIPDSVTSIGDEAFDYCSSLTNITIPDSVTSIGDYAFYRCSSLKSVTIGNGVTSIGGGAFYSCDSLKNVKIPDSVTSIGSYAFCSCYSLTSVTIGNGVTSIGSYAFYSCDSLKSIIFEDTSTWYRTMSQSDWNNKTGGTETSVTDASANAKYFTSTYVDYYWYKE